MKLTIFMVFVCLLLPARVSSQWTWRSPLPQGNDLHAITIRADHSVWAGGYVGTLMHSINGGVNWTVRNLTEHTNYVNFNGIHFPGDSTGFAVDEWGYVYKSTDAGATWDSIYYETEEYLSASCFTDPLNGHIVCSRGKILRTTNGGASWHAQYFNPSRWFNTVSFPSQQTGYAGAYNYILKTTDSGATWNAILDDTTKPITGIVFQTPDYGFAVGHEGLVMKTTNGGTTWNSQSLGDSIQFTSIGLFSADTILLTGIAYGTNIPVTYPMKFRSTDGGNTWVRLILPPGSPYTTALACYPGGKAYAAGYYGCLQKTEDYGTTWNLLYSVIAPVLHYGSSIGGIDFPSAQTGFVVAGGPEGPMMNVLKTTDGGATWVKLDPEFNNYATPVVDFITDDIGYICGTHIYYTSDGGTTWIRRVTGTGDDFRAISFATYLTGVAAGDNGLFMRTTDGGQSWGQVAGVPGITYKAVHFSDDTTGYAAGAKMILKTTDAGATWNLVSPYFTLNALWFTSRNRGFGAGPGGVIVRTTDGGESWDVMNTPVTGDLFAIHFYDADTGYVTGTGFVLKTTNGGTTWHKQSMATIRPLYAIRATGTSAFTGGWDCFLFGTTNGGISVSTGPVAIKPFISTSAFPNPASGPVTIRYTLASVSDVQFMFFDASGNQIRSPLMFRQGAGTYSLPFPSQGLNPGLYFYTLRVNDRTETRKVLLVK